MSFDILHDRLTALQETTAQLRELIDRLETLKFQPGSVPLGTDEEDSVSGELSSEITSILRIVTDDQELLQEDIGYLRADGDNKSRLLEGVRKISEELASHRTSFRKARLTAKRNIAEAQKLERQLIMKSYTQPATTTSDEPSEETLSPVPVQILRRRTQQHNYSSLSEVDQETVGASSNVTNALRRTHDLIASELSRSEFAHQTLTESSAALKQLDESYGSLDTMLVKSRDLLGTLLKSQKSDTWYLQTAMYMLMVTLGWLIFRRLLYGPIWWLVLFPVRILFGVGWKVSSIVAPAKPVASPARAHELNAKQQVDVEGLPGEDLPTIDTHERHTSLPIVETIDEAVKAATDEATEHLDDAQSDTHIVDEL